MKIKKLTGIGFLFDQWKKPFDCFRQLSKDGTKGSNVRKKGQKNRDD